MSLFQDRHFSSSKGNVVFTQESGRRYGDKIVTTAVHPGWFAGKPILYDRLTASLWIGMIRSELMRDVIDSESEPSGRFPDLTTLLTDLLGSSGKFVMRTLMYPASQGALTQLWAGTSPDTADLNGAVSTPSSPALSEAHAVRCSISSHGRGLASPAATTQS